MSGTRSVLSKDNRVASLASSRGGGSFLHSRNVSMVSSHVSHTMKLGNDITVNKCQQYSKMISVFIIPLIGIFSTTAIMLERAAATNAISSISINSITQTIEVSNLVIKLQIERGLTAVRLAALTSGDFDINIRRMNEARTNTNEVYTSMVRWNLGNFVRAKKLLQSNITIPLDGRNITTRQEFFSLLSWHRQRVDLNPHNISVEENIDFYAHLIDSMMTWNRRTYVLPDGRSMWSNILSMDTILRITESLGISRALGSSAYLRCSLKGITKAMFLSMEGIFEEQFEKSKQYCRTCTSLLETDKAKRTFATMDVLANRLYDRAWLANCETAYTTAQKTNNSVFYFSSATARIGVFVNVQRAVFAIVANELRQMEVETRNNLIIYAILNVVVTVSSIVLGSWYAVTIHTMIRSVSKCAKELDKNTKMLQIKKKETETILSQMLPKCVADLMLQGQEFQPESLDSVTIFCSDIVSFTTLAGRLIPIQVVELLNNLYLTFDNLIDHYDAFKVETVGDAYLVVSGAPVRNGLRHAGVMCDMSLQLQREIMQFASPGLKVGEVKIRIGLHTGPCVAAVVDQNMPRYCIFGQSVNIASKLEQTGEANRVHISQTTYMTLSQCGEDYPVEPSKECSIKLKKSSALRLSS